VLAYLKGLASHPQVEEIEYDAAVVANRKDPFTSAADTARSDASN
jgi:hypothetical protein